MRISVFYEHIREAAEQTGRTLPDLLDEVRSMGIDGIEIEGRVLAEDPEGITGRLSDAGLEVSNVYEFLDFGERHDDVRRALDVVDLAAGAGARRVMSIPGFLPADRAAALNAACDASYMETAIWMDGEPRTVAMRDALRRMVAHATGRGVTVTLEDFDATDSPIARMNGIAWFLESVPGIRHTLDTGNYAFSDEDCEEALERFRPAIAHVHCKDRGVEAGATPGRHYRGLGVVPVGGGYMPIARIVRSLADGGYDGYLAIEHFGAPDQLEYMRRSAAFLHGVIDGRVAADAGGGAGVAGDDAETA